MYSLFRKITRKEDQEKFDQIKTQLKELKEQNHLLIQEKDKLLEKMDELENRFQQIIEMILKFRLQ